VVVQAESLESLESILSRMDKAAPLFFVAFRADVRMLTYTSIINDKTEENGTLRMQRQDWSGARRLSISRARATRDRLLLRAMWSALLPKPEDGAGLRHGQEQRCFESTAVAWDSAPPAKNWRKHTRSARRVRKMLPG